MIDSLGSPWNYSSFGSSATYTFRTAASSTSAQQVFKPVPIDFLTRRPLTELERLDERIDEVCAVGAGALG